MKHRPSVYTSVFYRLDNSSGFGYRTTFLSLVAASMARPHVAVIQLSSSDGGVSGLNSHQTSSPLCLSYAPPCFLERMCTNSE